MWKWSFKLANQVIGLIQKVIKIIMNILGGLRDYVIIKSINNPLK